MEIKLDGFVHINNETVYRDEFVISDSEICRKCWTLSHNELLTEHKHVTNIRQQHLSYSVILFICYDIDFHNYY